MIAWNKRRYLSNGQLGNFAAFDSVSYVDMLFDEIGLTAHRNKGWLGNMFSPIMPADLGRAWQGSSRSVPDNELQLIRNRYITRVSYL